MLQRVTIKNFRGFREATTLELRPLTLLFGDNNAGKSTLLRLPAFIADALRGSVQEPLNLASPCFPEVTYRELLHGAGANPAIDIGLTFASGARFEWVVRSVEGLGEVVERFTMDGGSVERLRALLDLTPPVERASLRYTTEDHPRLVRDLRFVGLFPAMTAGRVGSLRAGDPLGDPTPEDLRVFPRSVQWLCATRAPIRRTFQASATPSAALSPNGEEAARAAAGHRAVMEEVAAGYQAIVGLRLGQRERAPGELQLVLSSDDAPFPVPLADSGEGLIQLLPVLVALARAQLGVGPRLVTIEQPELHLHPTAQEALGTWMCRLAAGASPPTVLVETHAENVLLSVLLAIIRGELDPARVLVYWVSRGRNGTATAARVEYDALARPIGDWPPEAFTSDNRLAMELVTRRLERGG